MERRLSQSISLPDQVTRPIAKLPLLKLQTPVGRQPLAYLLFTHLGQRSRHY